ncbi:hypothetical protein HPB52_003585 [Rhipicephalus sanguineus]|uniref:THAP-type domain-containing protein n=1 Tax=Rhipicephalus sanguineus TaxID=34632 RepID=A0A9D4QHT4_RHISA|nr:hypothetical protein HPB52_003585 [Rhipicephalus sanguineus]
MAPIFCPVKSCSSETGDNGYKFHRFPSDPALREMWVAFVRRGRGGDWTPTKRSLLCSRHFTPDAYTCSIQLMADFGLSTKNVRLKSRGKRDCRGNNLKRVGDPEVRAPAEARHGGLEQKRLRRDPEDSCRCYTQQTDASDHSSFVPTFASPSKGVKKQLIAAGKHRGCELIGLWRRFIIAHLYFAVGVGKGNRDLAIAVWLSLLNHIQDKPTGHGLLYPECKHGELERRKWILPGTDAYDRLHAIVTSKRLLDDVRQVSPNFQTFGVESFHSIINRFAPKCYALSHQGQLARCLLSALHYNENSGRMQAATKKGDLRWQIKHPKARGGEPVACPIRELPTYAYVNHLLSAVEELLACGSKDGTDATPQPPHLSAAHGPVDKVAIVEAHKLRFAGN